METTKDSLERSGNFINLRRLSGTSEWSRYDWRLVIQQDGSLGEGMVPRKYRINRNTDEKNKNLRVSNIKLQNRLLNNIKSSIKSLVFPNLNMLLEDEEGEEAENSPISYRNQHGVFVKLATPDSHFTGVSLVDDMLCFERKKQFNVKQTDSTIILFLGEVQEYKGYYTQMVWLNCSEPPEWIFDIANEHKVSIRVLVWDYNSVAPDWLIEGLSVPRYVMFDMDGTLTDMETLDEIAGYLQKGDIMRKATAEAMDGKAPFEESLKYRLKYVEGSNYSTLRNNVKIQPRKSAFELISYLRKADCHVGVVSGGFLDWAIDMAEVLKMDFVCANRLEVVDGLVTGSVNGPIIGKGTKGQLSAELNSLHSVMTIGDGDNDGDMVQVAGIYGIAFMGKDSLRKVSRFHINIPDLNIITALLL